MLQQYVDDMQLMIHHTIAAAMQLGISPLTQRVDPAALTGLLGPLRKLCSEKLLTLTLAGCMTRSLRFSLPVPLREGAAGGALFASCFFCCCVLLACLLSLCRCLFVVCCFLWFVYFFGRIGQSAPAMARCRNAAAGSNAPETIFANSFFLEGSCLC